MKKETKKIITDIMNEDAKDGLYMEDDIIMTSKEKAKYLIHKFYLSLPNNGSQTGINNVHNRWNESKNCALIAVDEMIRISAWGGDIDNEIEDGSKEFYMKVKQEIEKL